jgi:TetR/AcrR family transcriptional repressor of nem operon
MTTRAERKRTSRARILEAGAAGLREAGLEGAAIAPTMQRAGLTHGAFYAHFDSKEALTAAAFCHAVDAGIARWVGKLPDASWAARLARLAKRYLSVSHRDNRATGCALAAVGADSARAHAAFRRVYAEEVRKTLAAVCEASPVEVAQHPQCDDAIALLAMCIGGLTLARAVADPALSNRILKVCCKVAATGSCMPRKSGNNA